LALGPCAKEKGKARRRSRCARANAPEGEGGLGKSDGKDGCADCGGRVWKKKKKEGSGKMIKNK